MEQSPVSRFLLWLATLGRATAGDYARGGVQCRANLCGRRLSTNRVACRALLVGGDRMKVIITNRVVPGAIQVTVTVRDKVRTADHTVDSDCHLRLQFNGEQP